MSGNVPLRNVPDVRRTPETCRKLSPRVPCTDDFQQIQVRTDRYFRHSACPVVNCNHPDARQLCQRRTSGPCKRNRGDNGSQHRNDGHCLDLRAFIRRIVQPRSDSHPADVLRFHLHVDESHQMEESGRIPDGLRLPLPGSEHTEGNRLSAPVQRRSTGVPQATHELRNALGDPLHDHRRDNDPLPSVFRSNNEPYDAPCLCRSHPFQHRGSNGAW